jgi:prepilin-type N-terminal cleavage/methylation domain-containing protein
VQRGYTLVEMMVALAITSLVVAAVLTCFIWAAKQASLCAKMAWSQDEAMRTSGKLTEYVRNAKEIVSIDSSQGRWVTLRMPNNSQVKLAYTNLTTRTRDGRVLLSRTNRTEVIVARGLTEIMSSGGFTTPVFVKTGKNSLRISYRVAEPVGSGNRAVSDSAYAANVSFAACLRNATR